MSANLSDKGREAAALKAEKRASALRENLKRRKEAKDDKKREPDADPQDSQ